MESETFLGVLIRTLPALFVFALAFFAMSDKKTRDHWNNLMYQIGSIRPDQREDVKIGKNVKWPFFIVALALLLWPVQFYRHATKVIDASSSDLQKSTVSSDLTSTAGNSATGNGVTENSASNSASNTATPRSDLVPGTPAPPTSPAPQGDLVPAPR